MTRSRERRPDERGAIAVEFAICALLLVTLFFGVLEFGTLFHTRTAVNDASRTGARTAAALAREPGYQNRAVAAVLGATGDIRGSRLEAVTIYRADPVTGNPISGTYETCMVDCWRYLWDSGSGTLVQQFGPSWPPVSQRACAAEVHADYVGVWIRANHRWVTGWFGPDITFTERTVMRLEPLDPREVCR